MQTVYSLSAVAEATFKTAKKASGECRRDRHVAGSVPAKTPERRGRVAHSSSTVPPATFNTAKKAS